MKNENVFISTQHKTAVTTKEKILNAFISFDNREPDKTFYIWQFLAQQLYSMDELEVKMIK